MNFNFFTIEQQGRQQPLITIRALLLLSLLFLSFSFVSGSVLYDNPTVPKINVAKTSGSSFTNNTIGNVNNSQFLQGLTPQQVANLFTSVFLYNQTLPLINTFGMFWYNQTTPANTYADSIATPLTNVAYINITNNFTSNQIFSQDINITGSIRTNSIISPVNGLNGTNLFIGSNIAQITANTYGGTINITAGKGGGGTGLAGNLFINGGGLGGGAGTQGHIFITGGGGTGIAGNVSIIGGAGGTGTGGSVFIKAGTGATNGLIFIGGGTGGAGAGGTTTIAGQNGNSAKGGDLLLSAGTGSSSTGGNVIISAPNGAATGAGGGMNFSIGKHGGAGQADDGMMIFKDGNNNFLMTLGGNRTTNASFVNYGVQISTGGNVNINQTLTVGTILTLVPYSGAVPCTVTLNNSFMANYTGTYGCDTSGVANKLF